jgi:hypothetical protein
LEIVLVFSCDQLALVDAFNLLALVITVHGIAKRGWGAEWFIGVVVDYRALPVINGVNGLGVVSSTTDSGSPEYVTGRLTANIGTLPILVVGCLNEKAAVCWV